MRKGRPGVEIPPGARAIEGAGDAGDFGDAVRQVAENGGGDARRRSCRGGKGQRTGNVIARIDMVDLETGMRIGREGMVERGKGRRARLAAVRPVAVLFRAGEGGRFAVAPLDEGLRARGAEGVERSGLEAKGARIGCRGGAAEVECAASDPGRRAPAVDTALDLDPLAQEGIEQGAVERAVGKAQGEPVEEEGDPAARRGALDARAAD